MQRARFLQLAEVVGVTRRLIDGIRGGACSTTLAQCGVFDGFYDVAFVDVSYVLEHKVIRRALSRGASRNVRAKI